MCETEKNSNQFSYFIFVSSLIKKMFNENNNTNNNSKNFTTRRLEANFAFRCCKRKARIFLKKYFQSRRIEIPVGQFTDGEILLQLREIHPNLENNNSEKSEIGEILQESDRVRLELDKLKLEWKENRSWRRWIQRVRIEFKKRPYSMRECDAEAMNDDEKMIKLLKNKSVFFKNNKLGKFLNHWNSFISSNEPDDDPAKIIIKIKQQLHFEQQQQQTTTRNPQRKQARENHRRRVHYSALVRRRRVLDGRHLLQRRANQRR